MADLTKISSPIVTPPVSGASRASAPAPKGYAQADEVARRAGVLNEEESPKNKASLERLNRMMGSGQPLRGDVPRGFYLNITL